jgi:hypothetical protein
VAGVGGPEPRIDPWTLNFDRTLRRSRRSYLVEEQDGSGAWRERERFGSYDEAAEAFDHLSIDPERHFRIRELESRRLLNSRRMLRFAAVIVVVVVLIASAGWFVHLLGD